MKQRVLWALVGVAFLTFGSTVCQVCVAAAPTQQTPAGQDPPVILEGYVSATHFPGGFEINGEPVLVTAVTAYQRAAGAKAKAISATSDDLRPGMWVEAAGTPSEHGLDAVTVTLPALPEPKEPKAPKEKIPTIKGFGLILRVLVAGPEPVFEADGYRLRIPAKATIEFSGGLTTLNDATAGTWVKYDAVRDANGDLVAISAEFSPGRTGKKKPAQMEKDAAVRDAIPAHAVLIDAIGNFKTARQKVRLSGAGGQCGWHRLTDDPALQARVWRIGMSVVPVYQRQMPRDDAARIHFRFYVVDEPQIRSELGCSLGLILVPRQVVDRLKNDSQLAAVLADGVAYNLLAQSTKWVEENIELAGAVVGGDVLAQFYPWAGLGTEASVYVVAYKLERQMREQCGRVDLGLMADAGYDPWQAPEAWRLLAPKKLPADASKLKYPNQAGYQLAILHLQYAHEGAAKTPPDGAKADSSAAK